ncbi:MAG: glutamate synthase subunit alpha, partial [Methanobacteriota archaeon]
MKSDSAAFDNALEMLVAAGRSMPEALMMMIPEAFTHDKNIPEEKKAYYEYASCLMEPWDGPATISFTDGRYIGSVLDRNGLRPSRYCITSDDRVIMASEAGALPVDEEIIVKKGRLQPGKIFLVDTEEGRIIEDEEIKQKVITKNPYKKWLDQNLIHINDITESNEENVGSEKLFKLKKAFGYTEEELKMILPPMITEGKEAIGSMGADTPLAVLSDKPQLLFNYFKQLFAQVTNPPIDPIREKIIMSAHMYLGKEGNLLEETPQQCRKVKLDLPVITNAQMAAIKDLDMEGLKSKVIPITYKRQESGKGLKKALKNVFKAAEKAIEEGYTILILSDKGVDDSNMSIPSLLACSGLHHHLIRKGKRTQASIVVESGEVREVHHFAVLIGYGANAINPYLVFDIMKNELCAGENTHISYEEAQVNYLTSIEKGLYKIISKMGISTIQSYCGAQIFEAIGINRKVINKYFTGTDSRLGGIGLKTIALEQYMRHNDAFSGEQDEDLLASGGNYHWRRDGEFHQWNPNTIALLQKAVRLNDYSIYKEYAQFVNDPEKNPATIRSLLKFRERTPIDISEVEPVEKIVRRFATGAMSYGSISKEAHETLALAMNELGGFSNTGEGGEDSSRFEILPDGRSKRSRIKQIAQGRFGVSIEYLVNADQLQIKMAQGAKPGEGGQLPGHKVSKEIAAVRHTTPGVGLISPPPHHDIYSIE